MDNIGLADSMPLSWTVKNYKALKLIMLEKCAKMQHIWPWCPCWTIAPWSTFQKAPVELMLSSNWCNVTTYRFRESRYSRSNGKNRYLRGENVSPESRRNLTVQIRPVNTVPGYVVYHQARDVSGQSLFSWPTCILAFSNSLSAPIRQQPATVTANFGVRQGLVLSPFFFNIYLDDISRINDCTKRKCIIVYSDDIFCLFSWPTCMLAFSTPHMSRSRDTCHVIQSTTPATFQVRSKCM